MSLFFSTLTFSFEDFRTTSTVPIIRISQIGSSSKMEEADEYKAEVQQVFHFDDFISYHDASAIFNFWRKKVGKIDDFSVFQQSLVWFLTTDWF